MISINYVIDRLSIRPKMQGEKIEDIAGWGRVVRAPDELAAPDLQKIIRIPRVRREKQIVLLVDLKDLNQ